VGFDDRLDFAPLSFPPIEQAEFAKMVAELPTPKPCQINPSGLHQTRCQSQSLVPSSSFNPKPSKPVKNSGLFISPEKENKRKKYSASVAQQQKEQQNPSRQDRAPFNSTTVGGSTAKTPSDMPTIFQTYTGLPAQEQLQVQQNEGSPDVAKRHHKLEYQHPATLLDGDAANTVQQEEDYDFESMINIDQFDINDFLDMNGNSESTGQLSGDDLREKLPDTDTCSSGNSNSAPTQQTSIQAGSNSPEYSLDQFWATDDGHLDNGHSHSWGSESSPDADIVTVGLNMQVKKGSLMAEFGKNLHSR
jgi:hypothetical protein